MTLSSGRLTALALVVAAISAAVHLPGLFIGPSLDAAVFQVVGRGMAEGQLPYLDLWDHKPPVIYLVNAVAAWLAPGAAWPLIWIFSVSATAALAVAVAIACGHFTGPVVAGVAACLASLLGGQYLVALGGGLTEPFAAAFAAIAFALALRARRARQYIAIGMLLGLSLATSFQLAPAVLGVGIVAAHRPFGRLSSVAFTFVGFVVVLGVFALWLWIVGGLVAAWDATISYSAAYGAAARAIPGRWGSVPWTVLASLPLIAPALIGLLRLRHHRAATAAGYGSAAWMITAVLAWLVQDRFYAHYVIAVLPPLAVLAAIGLHDLSASVRSRRPWTAPAVVLVACFLVAVPAGIVGAQQEAVQWSAANRRADAVAAVLNGLSSPSSIWVWGNAPQVYLAADRDPANRFAYLLPLVTPDYATARLVHDVVDKLQDEAPSVIVDAGSPEPGSAGFAPLLIERPVIGSARGADMLQPFRDFVAERYELATVVDGWPVYRLTGDVSP